MLVKVLSPDKIWSAVSYRLIVWIKNLWIIDNVEFLFFSILIDNLKLVEVISWSWSAELFVNPILVEVLSWCLVEVSPASKNEVLSVVAWDMNRRVARDFH